jgi:dipeptidyl aminopeptidase/acylaminoacyl peptidase
VIAKSGGKLWRYDYRIAAILEAKKIPVQVVLFADEGHGVRKRKNRAISLATTLAFFKKHLAP